MQKEYHQLVLVHDHRTKGVETLEDYPCHEARVENVVPFVPALECGRTLGHCLADNACSVTASGLSFLFL